MGLEQVKIGDLSSSEIGPDESLFESQRSIHTELIQALTRECSHFAPSFYHQHDTVSSWRDDLPVVKMP
jgi:hypothetical protein